MFFSSRNSFNIVFFFKYDILSIKKKKFAYPCSSASPSAVSIPTSSYFFSKAARSSHASQNSPSSIPSPTCQ